MTQVTDVAQAHDLAIVEEWVRRLESGDYKQGRGVLRAAATWDRLADISTSKFCCLGVGCEMLCDLGLAERRVSTDTSDVLMKYRAKCVTIEDDWHSAILSDDLLRLLGNLSDEQADVLSRMNDTGSRNFTEIAAYIRRLYNL
jgi:hypothetical protein